MKRFIGKVIDDKLDKLMYANILEAETLADAEVMLIHQYEVKFGRCVYPVLVDEITTDVVFKAAEQSFRNSDDVAIMVAGRVFLTDLEQLPDAGVPIEDGVTFEFNGYEILPEDIGLLDDGEPYVDGCQEQKHFMCTNEKVLKEVKV